MKWLVPLILAILLIGAGQLSWKDVGPPDWGGWDYVRDYSEDRGWNYVKEASVATPYYVATDGDNNAAGTSTSVPWATVSYADTQVSAGDTVYVKAGDYGHEHVDFTADGTNLHHITYIGTDDSWGTIDDVDRLDIYNSDGLSAPSLDSSAMPLFDAGDGNGNGFDLSYRDYIDIKNFQITDYSVGVYSDYATHCKIENVIISACAGNGLRLDHSDYMHVLSCKAFGNEMYNIGFIAGHDSIIENCQANDPEGGIVTDYYFVVSGNFGDAYNHVIKHCYAENDHKGGDGHSGHGIGLKGEGNSVYGCLITDCVSKTCGEMLWVAGPDCYSNTIQYSWAINESSVASNPPKGIHIRDGAHDNNFYAVYTKDADFGVRFTDTSEEGTQTYSGEDNYFFNCFFENSTDAAIEFCGDGGNRPAKGNVWQNCIFYNTSDPSTAFVNYEGSAAPYVDNKIKDCIIYGFNDLEDNETNGSISFTYNCFYDNDHSTGLGTGNVGGDPLFTDAANDDFRLGSGSPASGTASGSKTISTIESGYITLDDMGLFWRSGFIYTNTGSVQSSAEQAELATLFAHIGSLYIPAVGGHPWGYSSAKILHGSADQLEELSYVPLVTYDSTIYPQDWDYGGTAEGLTWTDNEKLALITFLQPHNLPIPAPTSATSSALSQGDKQHLLALSPGILWFVLNADTQERTVKLPDRALVVNTPDRALTTKLLNRALITTIQE